MPLRVMINPSQTDYIWVNFSQGCEHRINIIGFTRFQIAQQQPGAIAAKLGRKIGKSDRISSTDTCAKAKPND